MRWTVSSGFAIKPSLWFLVSSAPTGPQAPGSLAGCCPVAHLRGLAPPQVMPQHRWPAWSSFHARLMTRKTRGSTVSVKAATPWNRSGQDQGREPGQTWCESSGLLTCMGALTWTCQQKNRRLSRDGSVSWQLNPLSCSYLFLWPSHKLQLLHKLCD